jgi:hypothetical protein
MTSSGQIVGKMDTQKQLNVPLHATATTFAPTTTSTSSFSPRRLAGAADATAAAPVVAATDKAPDESADLDDEAAFAHNEVQAPRGLQLLSGAGSNSTARGFRCAAQSGAGRNAATYPRNGTFEAAARTEHFRLALSGMRLWADAARETELPLHYSQLGSSRHVAAACPTPELVFEKGDQRIENAWQNSDQSSWPCGKR